MRLPVSRNIEAMQPEVRRRAGSALLAGCLLTFVASAQQGTRMVIEAAELEAHAHKVVDQAGIKELEDVQCPDDVPQKMGEITACSVKDASGRNLVVYIEQTDAEGSVFGTLDDPVAAQSFNSLQEAFVDTISAGTTVKLFDGWLSDDLRKSLGDGRLDRVIGCRRATMGRLSVARRVGARIEADGNSGVLVLRLASEARPVRVTLYLVRAGAGWRIESLNFPPPLPVDLPPPGVVVDRLNSFLNAYAVNDWERALEGSTVDFEIAWTNLRPKVELELKRGMLGSPIEAGKPRLSIDNRGIITVQAPVKFERTPGTLRLGYAVCGEQIALNSYAIDVAPDTIMEVPADYLQRVMELELWRSNYGEVSVTCPDLESVRMAPGVTLECRAQRGDEIARALVKFKSSAGQFEISMLPPE